MNKCRLSFIACKIEVIRDDLMICQFDLTVIGMDLNKHNKYMYVGIVFVDYQGTEHH